MKSKIFGRTGHDLPGRRMLKWSGKFEQRAKMYPTLTRGYTNDEEAQLFGKV